MNKMLLVVILAATLCSAQLDTSSGNITGTTSTIVLIDRSAHFLLNEKMEVMVDSSGAWTIDSLISMNTENKYVPAASRLNFGYNDFPLWVRSTIRNEIHDIPEWYLSVQYAALNIVECHLVSNRTILRSMRSGIDFPYKERIVQHQYHVFPVAIPYKNEITVYLKIYSQYSLLAPIEVTSFNEFFSEDKVRTYFQGVFWGAMIALILYNTFLFISVRDKSYLWYSLYAMLFGLYLAARDNIFGQFAWLDHPFVVVYSISIGAGGLFVFGSLFAIEFLQLKKLSSGLYRTMQGLMLIGILTIIALVVNPLLTSKLLNYIAIIYVVSTLVVGLIAWKDGSTFAPLYVAATFMIVISTFSRILRTTGVVQTNFLSEHGLSIGILLEMSILAFALGFRINTLKKEKEEEKQKLRSTLAADLHDDVSATLSSIDFYAEAMIRSGSILPGNGMDLHQKIVTNAREAKERITDIIWSINPMNDSWENLLSKSQRFMEEMFEAKGIDHQVTIQKNIAVRLSLEQKQQVWLIIKEIITNICRHAEASAAEVNIQQLRKTLHCTFRDNGRGFDADTGQQNNGIANIHKRTALLNGSAVLTTAPGSGTTWSIMIPL